MEILIEGFSKKNKQEKLEAIAQFFKSPEKTLEIFKSFDHPEAAVQEVINEFSENTISNFHLPYSIAPNFLINGKTFAVPMVIEESSVVAAAAKSAKFWSKRGGFKTTVLNTEKIGQVHFIYKGDKSKLVDFFNQTRPKFYTETESITKNMQKRGGGILDIILNDKTADLENYYQLHATFETKDSMGANFINSCLEQFAKTLKQEAQSFEIFSEEEKNIEVVMSILSNYVTNCIVRAEVSCQIEELAEKQIENPKEFAEKFVQAVQIAQIEPYRAVTHNKGIMNGIDSVVLATGNDFRAVEAGAHAYASRDGKYSSLSHATIENGIFKFWLEIPLALGTVGGLTSLHPLVKLNLEILEKPSARELMQIVAAVGLAQNFAALRSLTTKGIQEGHMKMHINNILNQYHATAEERIKVAEYFKDNTISHASVAGFLEEIRK